VAVPAPESEEDPLSDVESRSEDEDYDESEEAEESPSSQSEGEEESAAPSPVDPRRFRKAHYLPVAAGQDDNTDAREYETDPEEEEELARIEQEEKEIYGDFVVPDSEVSEEEEEPEPPRKKVIPVKKVTKYYLADAPKKRITPEPVKVEEPKVEEAAPAPQPETSQ
jgi:hypothetical protein